MLYVDEEVVGLVDSVSGKYCSIDTVDLDSLRTLITYGHLVITTTHWITEQVRKVLHPWHSVQQLHEKKSNTHQNPLFQYWQHQDTVELPRLVHEKPGPTISMHMSIPYISCNLK